MKNEVFIVILKENKAIEGVYSCYDHAVTAVFDYLNIFYHNKMIDYYKDYSDSNYVIPFDYNEWLVQTIEQGEMDDFIYIETHKIG